MRSAIFDPVNSNVNDFLSGEVVGNSGKAPHQVHATFRG